MSETRHSPEPWRRGSGCVLDATGHITAAPNSGGSAEPGAVREAMEADARRIVACVNALAGIPTEALEAGKVRVVLDAVAAWSDIQNLSIHDPAIKARVDALEFAWRALKETP